MPRIERTNEQPNAFAKKERVQTSKKEQTMSENTEANIEVAEQSNIANSPVSVAELYAEMEKELVIKGVSQNTGVTERIRTLVEQIFASTGKDRLLLSAVVKIVEKQEGRTKMYNLVRSVGMSKSENAKYGLLSEEGRTYIVHKGN